MPRLNVKLAHKATMLVAVLLSFELLLLGLLYVQLQQAEADARAFERGASNVGTLDGMLWNISRAASALAMYATMRNQKYSDEFDALIKQVDDQSQALRKSLDQDPERRDDARAMAKTFDECLIQMKAYKTELENNGVLGLRKLSKFINPQGIPILQQVKLFVDKEQERNRNFLPQQARENRERMKLVVAAGVAFNVIIAVLLLRLFLKGITQKVDLLTDNTLRLKYGQPLNPELAGTDELSSLDQVFHSMAAALDQAKEKQAQALETIRSSEERVRSLIENMTIGLITIDEHGAVQSLNPRMEEMFSVGRDQIKGTSVTELFELNGGDEPQRFLSMLQQKATGRVVELMARRRGGGLFPVEVSVNEVRYAAETVLLANVQDVSARHEIERMKREFVAMVSHDLRTPLTSIRGTITLVQTEVCGAVPDEAKQLLAEADTELVRLTRLISDLLDIARIEAGKLQLDVRNVQLEPIVRQSISAISNLAQAQGLTIKIADLSELAVHADSERIIQVLVNLLSNAIKFSDAGSSIEISAQPRDEMVEVRVADTGRGVPLEHQRAIFERFQQVEKSDASVKGGTGLGLPICKTIVQQHGGAIGVESNGSHGSTFWFTLPRA